MSFQPIKNYNPLFPDDQSFQQDEIDIVRKAWEKTKKKPYSDICPMYWPFKIFNAPATPQEIKEMSLFVAGQFYSAHPNLYKIWGRMLAVSCYQNSKNFSLDLIQSLMRQSPHISMFDVFAQCTSLEEIEEVQTLAKHDQKLTKQLMLASLSNPKVTSYTLSWIKEHYSKEEILNEFIPKMDNPQALKILFREKFLTKEDSLSPGLIGPWLITSRDKMLNVLYRKNKKLFLKKLVDFNHQKRVFPLPYIARNFKIFQNDPNLIDVCSSTKNIWANEASKEGLNEREFESFLEKHLMQKEISQLENIPSSKTRKM